MGSVAIFLKENWRVTWHANQFSYGKSNCDFSMQTRLDYFPVGKIAIKTVWRSAFLLIRHSNYCVILSKIHSYRLLFPQFAHWV